jgi:hypothetical protein
LRWRHEDLTDPFSARHLREEERGIRTGDICEHSSHPRTGAENQDEEKKTRGFHGR